MRKLLLSTMLLLAGLAGAACAGGSGDTAGSEESEANTPLDRLMIGKATAYAADVDMQARFSKLQASEIERRKTAWEVVQRVLEPVAVDADGQNIPRFQTWYGKDEVIPIFEKLLLAQTPEERAQRRPPSREAIEEAFTWATTRAKTLPSWSEERLAQRKAEVAANGAESLGGPERVLMSPGMLGHILGNYDAILGCMNGGYPAPNAAPPSPANFAPCVGTEFPVDAVVVKARWVADAADLETHDTSAAALETALTARTWSSSTPRPIGRPDERGIYTMKLPNGVKMRLAALHIVTKELRDWMWISMFWSDKPSTDFGADRPSAMAGPWANYKMCAVVDFDEGDDGKVAPADRTLAAALASTRKFGPRSWCSNPYLEHGAGNATTNCIGCHQHAGTDHSTTTILEGPTAFPDGSRARLRKNFPADYTFTTNTGLELAMRMRDKVNQLAPPPVTVDAGAPASDASPLGR